MSLSAALAYAPIPPYTTDITDIIDQQLNNTIRLNKTTSSIQDKDVYKPDWSESIYPIHPYGFHDTITLDELQQYWLINHNKSISKQNNVLHDAVTVVDDIVLNEAVIEIIKYNSNITQKYSTYIQFPQSHTDYIGSTLSHCNIHIKNMMKYCAVAVDVRGINNKQYTIMLSNSVTIGRVYDSTIELPLQLISSWNIVAIDLQHILQSTMGIQYKHTIRLRIYPSCRIRRIFFSNQKHTNNSTLPPSLQLHTVKQTITQHNMMT